MMKNLMMAAGLLVAVVLVLGPGGPGPALAQWPNYMLPDKKEKPKDDKPPGQLTPGPQGSSKFGWGQTQKTPSAIGSGPQRWKKSSSQEHVAPSKPKKSMQPLTQETETKGPKGPPQPKVPRTSQDLDFSAPDQAKTSGGPGKMPKPFLPPDEGESADRPSR